MLAMMAKMSALVLLYTLVTILWWHFMKNRQMTTLWKLFIGVFFGGCAVLSTHFGVEYIHMILNVRDMGPLIAGLFFDPFAGIVAGLIGGIERYIAGAYFGVGAYTKIACSASTCLAGFVAAGMNVVIFKGKKPSIVYAFFMGAVMEVFHMYVVLITHRDDIDMAFYVVKICSLPMICFCGLGLAIISLILRQLSPDRLKLFRKIKEEETRVSQQFEFWLFIVTGTIIVLSIIFTYRLQTSSAIQYSREDMSKIATDIRQTYERVRKNGDDFGALNFHVGDNGSFEIISKNGIIIAGKHKGQLVNLNDLEALQAFDDGFVLETVFGIECFCYIEKLDEGEILLVRKPSTEVYEDRNEAILEAIFADILLFAVIYVLVSMLVQAIVVDNLDLVNASLAKITDGNLDEEVSVYKSSEFASLSNDINETVNVLKGYIAAAEKKMEQELLFAKIIQESALPKKFDFPGACFDIYASMNPAKEVGGDFYDFFYVGQDNFCVVIADVAGKGIPAALFMMRSKTAIRTMAESGNSPTEILQKANDILCEGNEVDMFVTVWIGILNIKTGLMSCANAGHEYPILKKGDGDFEIYKDKHSCAVATMEGVKFKGYELQLEPGDILFVYTDGAPEAINIDTKQYGVGRLLEVLNANKDVPMERLLNRISRNLAEFVGEAEQFDDVTMLGFKYKG
ncbi:MAG: SpoIIE family protein phosphatase [Butyrivibrio sp.]|nr:SpoIIE family protein phosphatase [Butyrivibrio sp.]